MTGSGGRQLTTRQVRESAATPIASFRQLVEAVARLSFHNPDYFLIYRGQRRDHLIESNATSLYPAIYRSEGSLPNAELRSRFQTLDRAAALLHAEFRSHSIEGSAKLGKFPELTWAMLQHYEVCPTPLLDVTQSLRVAASFALERAAGRRSCVRAGISARPWQHQLLRWKRNCSTSACCRSARPTPSARTSRRASSSARFRRCARPSIRRRTARRGCWRSSASPPPASGTSSSRPSRTMPCSRRKTGCGTSAPGCVPNCMGRGGSPRRPATCSDLRAGGRHRHLAAAGGSRMLSCAHPTLSHCAQP
ncbi:MAG: FRG domain-containing protein [Comamonadaceae bacterium]|nr:FRG domain-containing protein [Comamonadaceae bacterium]